MWVHDTDLLYVGGFGKRKQENLIFVMCLVLPRGREATPAYELTSIITASEWQVSSSLEDH